MILLVSLGLTFLAYDSGSNYRRQSDEAQMRRQSQFLEQRLIDHIKDYDQILIAIISLFKSSEVVTQEEWQTFISSLKVQDRYPGYWAIAYAPLVENAKKDEFVAEVHKGSLKEYAIKSESNAHDLYPVLYLTSPQEFSPMLGVDLGVEPIRRQTIEQARDSGEAILSPPLSLMNDNEGRTSMILMRPLYAKNQPTFTLEQRRRAFQGILSTPVILSDLIGKSLSQALRPGQLTILDSADFNRPIFRSSTKEMDPTREVFEHNSRIDLLNRTWIFHWKMPTSGDGIGKNANLILIFGSLASFLTFAVVSYLTANRDLAIRIADRKTQLLRDASSLQQAILDGVRYAIVSVDEEGYIRHFNRTAENEFGYSAGEMIGVLGLDLLFDSTEMEDRAIRISADRGRNIAPGLQLLVELEKDNRAIHQDWMSIKKDGTRFPVQISVSTLLDESENITGYAIICLNISAQKTAEHIQSTRLTITETLARSETSHGALPTVLSILGASLGFDACAFWSYNDESEFFKKDYQWADESVHLRGHDDIDRSAQYINNKELGLVKTLRPLSFSPLKDERFALDTFQSVFIVPLQCGEEFRGCCSLYSLADKGNDPAIFDTLHEIGLLLGQFQKRLSAEQALRESEERFKAFMENSPVLAYIKNEEGRVVYVNEHGARSFGLRSYELLDRKLQDILPQAIYEPVLAAEGRAWNDNRSVSELCHVRDEQGRESFWMMFHFLLKAQSGKRFLGAISIDVTEQKRIEIEIQTAWKLAEEANQSKNEFLANVSHEVRTPMNGIIGMAELLLRTQLLPEQRDYLNMMMFSADSLLGIVNDILDFSKIDAGKLSLETVDFNLQDIIGGAVRPLYPRAYEKGVQFLIDYDADLPSLYLGDPLRLSQVIINLLSNAIKFTHHGRVLLSVKSLSHSQGLQGLRIAVEDTGIGISMEKQMLIFEAFAQADGSTSRHFGGSGLGLTISSRLVQMMGSHIEVKSQLDHGSIFQFDIELPLLASEANELASGPKITAFIGDSSESTGLLDQTLTKLGLRPLRFESIFRAYAQLVKYRADGINCDFVIIDLGLGHSACHDYLRQMRSDPNFIGTKIIVIVAEISQLSIALCREFEVDEQLLKPILPQDLKAAFRGQRHLPKTFQYSARELQHAGIGTNIKVLLVEDNAINQTLALRLLERKGCRVVLAKNGNEAVTAAMTEPFDLILMDIQMPGKGGVEATQDIRRDRTNGKSFIVAMTAHAMQGDRERFLASGMDAYLSKPIRVEELFSMVDQVGSRILKKEALGPGKLVDDGQFLDSLGGDRDLLQELCRKFLEDAPQTLLQLERAVKERNASDIEMWAHKLKGSFSILMAASAVAVTQRLELMGETHELSEVDQVLKEIQQLFPPIVAELRLSIPVPDAA